MPDFLTPGRQNLRRMAKAGIKVCDGPADGDEFDSLCQDAFARLTVVYLSLAKAHHRAVQEREELEEAANKKSKVKKVALDNLDAYDDKRKLEIYKKKFPKEFATMLKKYKEEEEQVPVNGESMDDCPECNGTGTVNPEDTGLVSCDNCDGSGQVCAICEQPKTSCTCDEEDNE